MKIEVLDSVPDMRDGIPVKVKEMGNITETLYMSNRNNKQTIRMLPGGEQYEICATKEIKDVKHYKSRADGIKNLLKTFNSARDLINTNCTDVSKVRWCTLTYAENMTDTSRLCKDFNKFTMRFNTYCQNHGYSKPEYIAMMEPQARGAWHCHLLYIWQDMKAPYIPNSDFSKVWGHGFVKVTKLDDIDNIGAYLTAYLTDFDMSDVTIEDWVEKDMQFYSGKVKTVEVLDGGTFKTKQIIKGARLALYPPKFNIIRHSKGVKKPKVSLVSQETANKKVLGASKTFSKSLKLTDEKTGYSSVIIKEQFNLAKKSIPQE